MTQPLLLVDLRVAQTYRERGIARYSQSLVLAVARERPDLELALLVDSGRDAPLLMAELARHARVIEDTRSISAIDRPITHFLQSALFEERKSIYELFPRELGRHRPQLGAIVYDLIPWLFPNEYLSDPDSKDAYLRVLPAMAHLDRLFALSESVRRDVIAIAKAEPSRVVTIYGGFDEDRWPRRTPTAIDSVAGTRVRIRNEEGIGFDLPSSYWLYVGGDDWRKNLPRLFEAFGILKRRGRHAAPLVLACSITSNRRDDLLKLAEERGLRPGEDVVFTGYVSDEVLGQVYAHSLATVFPSIYEGLGLPIVESYAFGKPVLASDTSSLKELVPDPCRFDPLNGAAIAGALERFLEDPQLAEVSLEFGSHVLSKCRWSSAAERLVEWIDGGITLPSAARPSRPLWVASSLPPARSGVAYFTLRSLGAPRHPLTFFAPVDCAADLEATRAELARARHLIQGEPEPVEALALSTLPGAREPWPDQPVLFVLGNSEHHARTLAHLLEYGAHPGDVVHLHDIFLGGLLSAHFGIGHALREALLYAYSADEIRNALRGGPFLEDAAGGLLGPRLLVERCGVKHFIVNSRGAADHLRNDLGNGADVTIDVAFLPVLPTKTRARASETDRLSVGHFGIIGPTKQLDRLVEACDLLSQKRLVSLVVAGYGVTDYLQGRRLLRPYFDVFDSPTTEVFEGLMSQVDCAVQLRYPDHGESSGVVNQLLALQRPVICTRTGSFGELEGAVSLVDPDADATRLAAVIEEVALSGWPEAADSIVARLSPAAFEERLREIMTGDRSPAAIAG